VGAKNIPSKGPVVFLANHQNALVDALLVATTQRRVIHSLTRGDIFKNPLVGWLLSTFNMVPVYRFRDGWQAINDNAESINHCTRLLTQGGCMFLFPEGSHSAHRRLRPLTKGFTRIIAETLKLSPELKIQIIPVGLNYTHPQEFGGSVSLHFGKPMPVTFSPGEEFQAWSTRLREDIFQQMKSLITHIEPLDRYDELLARLEARHPDYLDPEKTNALLEKLKSEPNPGTPAQPKKSNRPHFALAFAFLFNSLPLLLWFSISGKIKDPVFISTAKLGLGLIVFPAFYLLQGFLAGWLFESPLIGTAIGIASVCSLPIYKRTKKFTG
jgi:1-acyl-sn-glycerol-3-phosphate acyltransferase